MLISRIAVIVCAVHILWSEASCCIFGLYSPSQRSIHHIASRFFPSVYYLSTSKVAIAVLGNFAFAVALCTYFLLTKVPRSLLPLHDQAHAWPSDELACSLSAVSPDL